MNQTNFAREWARRGSIALWLSILAACGGGGGGSDDPAPPPESASDAPSPDATANTQAISGSGVKGPLAGAVVNAYAFLAGSDDFKGASIATGETNARAEIAGLAVTLPLPQLLILEVLADDDTVDITTGGQPVVKRLITVVDSSELSSPVYPSPLTTAAYKLAVENADSTKQPYTGDGDGVVSSTEFLSAFKVASKQVASVFGFGVSADINLNTTPPLVTQNTDTVEAQRKSVQYRMAIEAFSAVVENLRKEAVANNSASTVTADSLVDALAKDLSDGEIDGSSATGQIQEFNDVSDVAAAVTVDPSTLKIPGTDTPVSEVSKVMVAEKETTGNDQNTQAMEDGTVSESPKQARTAPDIDEDSVADASDNCPTVSNETQEDRDSDTYGDACDAFPDDASEWSDRDGDGVGDNSDMFPNDPAESRDSDKDGVGDNADAFPEDPAETKDSDGDGIGDNADAFPGDASESKDTDGDGVGDNTDAFPNDPAESKDTDGDGVGDNRDAFPGDAAETTDTDGDGVGDNADSYPNDSAESKDSDGDGVGDNADAFPNDPAETNDADGDGVGDNADAFPQDPVESVDTDGDGVGDNRDAFPENPNETADTDGDGIGDNVDNCPEVANADQVDSDANGVGDSCEPDPNTENAVWDSSNWDEANWQ